MSDYDELFSMLCGNCDHEARRHLGNVSVCAECWKQLMTICEHFVLKKTDRERADALFKALGAT